MLPENFKSPSQNDKPISPTHWTYSLTIFVFTLLKLGMFIRSVTFILLEICLALQIILQIVFVQRCVFT